MAATFNHPGQQEFLKRIKTLMLLRVLVVTGFVGAIFAFQRSLELPNIIPLSILICITYFLTLIYAIVLKWVKNLTLFCYLQITADLFLEGGVIYITGGIDSPFSILFNFSIISASITLSRQGGYIIASLAAIIFGSLLDLEFYGILHPIRIYPPSPMSGFEGYVFNIIYLNFSAFFIIAFLSGFLVDKLRRTHEELVEKSGSLVELQTFHENVVRYMGDGLLTTNTSWRITSFNYAAEKITGHTQAEVVERPLLSIFPFLENKIPVDLKESLPTPLRTEGKVVRKDGKDIVIGINLSTLFDKKQLIKGAIVVFQDLTYLKEMEQKLVKSERLAAIGHLSASLAHEIRNPLASISGSTQVLKGEFKPDGANLRLMNIVVEESDRLNMIISQFLEYANPKPPRIEKTNVTTLIEDTVFLLKNNKELSRNIKIEMELKDGDIFCDIDPQQIKQVLWNLSLNGVQAMQDGGLLKITTSKYDPDLAGKNSQLFFSGVRAEGEQGTLTGSGRLLKIDVMDGGCGVGENDMKKIFEPFFTTKEKGSGLGLATVYRVIENHNGYIKIKNREPHGAVFSVFLPLSQDV